LCQPSTETLFLGFHDLLPATAWSICRCETTERSRDFRVPLSREERKVACPTLDR
jgi:hypothetical protein